MYERARIKLVSEIAPALKVSAEEAEAFLDQALAKGVLKPAKGGAKAEKAEKAEKAPVSDDATPEDKAEKPVAAKAEKPAGPKAEKAPAKKAEKPVAAKVEKAPAKKAADKAPAPSAKPTKTPAKKAAAK
jgi:hypothetical protein